jgi:hypothetical protein
MRVSRKNPLSRALLAATVLVVGTVANASSADAQQYGGIDGVRFDVHLDLGWYGAFGAGFRADIPIVPDGIVDGVSDDLAISPGIDVFFLTYNDYYDDDGGVAFAPLVALQWNFYVSEHWSLFPELGFAMLIGDYGYGHRHHNDRVHASLFLGLGARYHFNTRNALLMRISWPAGFQIGITF